MKPLYVILVDFSGSMEPAWRVALDLVFDIASKAPASFLVLGFKQQLTDRDRRLLPTDENGVLRCAWYDITCGGVNIVDIGCVWSYRGVRRLRRGSIEPPLTFSRRTPLNAAILATAWAVDNRLAAPFELHVISDNRDTASSCSAHTVKQQLDYLRRVGRLRRVVLHCVGNCLHKYLEPYDEVVEHNTVNAVQLSCPSPFL